MQPKYYGAAANYNSGGSGIGANLLKIIGLILGVIVLITIGFFVVNAITSGPREEAARLVVRERQLLSLIASNQDKITGETLRAINSSATSLLTSDTYALQQSLASTYSLALKDIPDHITASESDTRSTAQLTAAQVESRFDQVYAQILRDKIAASLQLANSLATSSSGTFKTAVQTSVDNLKAIDAQLNKQP